MVIFWRRLAAGFYDIFLIIALLIFATALLLPFNHGHAITTHPTLLLFYLISIWMGFYIWFWLHGGQTLGMVVWRLQLQSLNNHPIHFKQALLRALLAVPSWLLCGIGFITMVFNKDRLTWYDKGSKTKVVLLRAIKEGHGDNAD